MALDAADVELHRGVADVAAVELGDGEAGGDGFAGDVVRAVEGCGGDADAALGEGQGEGGASDAGGAAMRGKDRAAQAGKGCGAMGRERL